LHGRLYANARPTKKDDVAHRVVDEALVVVPEEEDAHWVMEVALWRDKVDGKEWIYDDENYKYEKVVATPVDKDHLQEVMPAGVCGGMSRSSCLESELQKGITTVLAAAAPITVELSQDASHMKLYCRQAKEAELNTDWSVCYERPVKVAGAMEIIYSAGSAVVVLGLFGFALLVLKKKRICFQAHPDDEEDTGMEMPRRSQVSMASDSKSPPDHWHGGREPLFKSGKDHLNSSNFSEGDTA